MSIYQTKMVHESYQKIGICQYG